MPVDFLTPEQEQRYGHYSGDPTPAQLARYFQFDAADRARIAAHRGAHSRLGFALQLGTVRFLGTFLADPTAVPPTVVRYVAVQIGADPAVVVQYASGETHWDHAAEIRRHYGYQEFSTQPAHFQLVRWLYTRAWVSAERPSVLFDLATARLVEHKILLPGVSVLARLVAQVRDRAAARLWQRLARVPTAAQQARLEALLQAPDGARLTALERLRRAPTRITAPALVRALDRLSEIRALCGGGLDLAAVPPGRVQALARFANSARAQAIARMPATRRLATLVAWTQVARATAHDDVLDLLDQLVGTLLLRVERQRRQGRLRSLGDLDGAALQLQAACQIVLDLAHADAEVRAAIFARIPRPELEVAVTTVATLARTPADETATRLLTRYSHIQQFLPKLLRTLTFAGNASAAPVLAALRFLQESEGHARLDPAKLPRAVVTGAWKPLVFGADKTAAVNRRAYTCCALEALRAGLRRRDLFISPSYRWADPRRKLLQGAAWEAARPQICRTLGQPATPEAALAALTEEVTQAYQRTAAHLPTNTAVRIERRAGRETLVLTGLDKLEDPASLVALREDVAALLPRVELPEILLEVAAWTGFLDAFTHVSERDARVEELPVSLCAVLVAQACNIGLTPLAQARTPALTPDRLAWVAQHYLRADTLTQANARLVDYQARLPLAQQWGGGEVASADGLRFVVPVRTLNAGPNSKYFGVGRGVTYYNFTSDQFTGFHAIVIPGTLRDSLYILDGLLEQQTSLRPTELMADTAGYSDLVFGLFWLLGYQFSPRLADVGESRLWRMDKAADYGALTGVVRGTINVNLIATQWDDLLRVAGSLAMGTVSASEIIRALGGDGRPTALARAISELGRVAKTLYQLPYLDDAAYRRRILTQLNRGESRHSLARVLFHGQRGELRQRYREGQEDQLGALGLVLNVVVLWTTRYMEVALAHLRQQGDAITAADVERLSPLGSAHINLLGRYDFTLAEPLTRGELRPLQDPTTARQLELDSA